MDDIRLKALAKINIGLDVTGCREDGYHLVRMIMQTVHLFDSIQMARMKKKGIKLTVNMRFLPTDEHNLAYRAAKLLMDQYGIADGIHIDIKKCIPIAAGMAGGSADAAAVLYGMNRIFDLRLSGGQLAEYGLRLGADVPYCLMRGTALAEGIGERLTKLPPMPRCPVLIAKPGVSVSTKWVYENLQLREDVRHPDIDRLSADIEAHDLKRIAAHMGNILEEVTVKEYPVIRQIKELMIKHGALNAMMSGSGPTVFGLFEDRETAKRAAGQLRLSGLARQIFVTTVFNV